MTLPFAKRPDTESTPQGVARPRLAELAVVRSRMLAVMPVAGRVSAFIAALALTTPLQALKTDLTSQRVSTSPGRVLPRYLPLH